MRPHEQRAQRIDVHAVLRRIHVPRSVAQCRQAFLIEHDVQFVMTVCDHIVALDFGKQIGEGSPEVVRNDPAVVSAYLGETEEEIEEERALVGEAAQ